MFVSIIQIVLPSNITCTMKYDTLIDMKLRFPIAISIRRTIPALLRISLRQTAIFGTYDYLWDIRLSLGHTTIFWTYGHSLGYTTTH